MKSKLKSKYKFGELITEKSLNEILFSEAIAKWT